MSSESQEDMTSRGGSVRQNNPVKRVIIYAAILLGAFLLGFVPMWMRANERARERDTAQAALRVSTLQNTLANAAMDSRRGEYEAARRAASEFFTNLRTETERGGDSVFNESQRSALSTIFDTRDDTITLLARSDPSAADRLLDLYHKYRQAVGGAPTR